MDLPTGRRIKDISWATPMRVVLGRQMPPKPKGPPPGKKMRAVRRLPPVPNFPPPEDSPSSRTQPSPRPPNRPVPRGDEGRRATPVAKPVLNVAGPPKAPTVATLGASHSWAPPVSGGATPKAIKSRTPWDQSG